MKLDDLICGEEEIIREWLNSNELLHQCTCGYVVYDPDDVIDAVQDAFGDSRCDEIFDWAYKLSNEFDWMFLKTSNPKFGIYHCHYCNGSEHGMISDIMIMSEALPIDKVKVINTEESKIPSDSNSSAKYLVFIDESYSDEYPRKLEGSICVAAIIIPESSYGKLGDELKKNIRLFYRSKPPKELKYIKYKKSGRLLDCIGKCIIQLIYAIPDCYVVGLYVPREGLFSEKKRSIKAVSIYGKSSPDPVELSEVKSEDSIEKAVRNVVSEMTRTVIFCAGTFCAHRNSSAHFILDPRNSGTDAKLIEEIGKILPKLFKNRLRFIIGDSLVTTYPRYDHERLGDRFIFSNDKSSEESFGLQLADFFAGDIREFFNNSTELLDFSCTDEMLVNKNVMFPNIAKITDIPSKIMNYFVNRVDASFFPKYRHKLANGIISYFTRNGHMRNCDLINWKVHDLID